MKSEVNVVDFGKKIPLSVSVVQFDHVLRHCHSNPQIILVLDGECTLELDTESYEMKKEDIIIVNEGVYHQFASKKKALVISAQFNLKEFGLEESEVHNTFFTLNSVKDPLNKKSDSIAYLLYSIIKYNTLDNRNSVYTNRAIAFSFFSQLMNDFSIRSNESKTSKNKMDTISLLTSYLHGHYKENIELEDLASRFHYSVPYISRLFKSSLGVNYLHYYDELRVNYSVEDLLNTNMSIEQIAGNNGFENARKFVRAFKKFYNSNPSQYRSKINNKKEKNFDEQSKETRRIALDIILAEYNKFNKKRGHGENIKDTSFSLEIGADEEKGTFSNPLKQIIFFQNGSDLLATFSNPDDSKTINRLKFSYADIGQFFPDLENRSRSIGFLNQLITVILKNDLKPSIAFIMKEKLSIEEYQDFFEEFFEGLKKKYQSEMSSWRFSFSCQGQLKENYVSLFRLYRELKNKFNFSLLSPLFRNQDILNGNYELYYKGQRKEDVKFDYLVLNLSPLKEEPLIEKNHFASIIKELNEEHLFEPKKTIIQDVSYSGKTIELLSDTSYQSCFLANTLLELPTYAISKTFSSFDAVYDEELFHGYNCLYSGKMKKSISNAYELFTRLNGELVERGDKYLILRHEDKLKMLFVNYQHYSSLYAQSGYYEASPNDRYSCFSKGSNYHFHLLLNGLDVNKAKVKAYSIGKNSGSSFDKWLELGAPNTLNEEEKESICSLSLPSFQIKEIPVEKKSLKLEISLSPLEVKYIEVSLIKE